ncbi:unnamed protein product, partial [Polarella glacialis]
AVVDGPEVVTESARQCCADWEAAEPKLRSAVWKQRVWPGIYDASARLDRERTTQDGLQTLLQVEGTKKHLLDAERVAPPEARRALAAMRSASAAGNARLQEKIVQLE